MNHLSTSQIAKIIGVHPNTIRFYEDLKLLPKISRATNGYRVFNERHIEQLRFLRIAFRAEIISSRLRQEAYEIVKILAADSICDAYQSTQLYLSHIQEERKRAEEALLIALELIENSSKADVSENFHGRIEASKILGITTDVLRDWERNGLIQVPRASNKYRKYSITEINRLKIIRTLRNAHYSMMSILRMLNHLDKGNKNIRETINTPNDDEDIVCAADRYITALHMAENDANEMLEILGTMINNHT